MLITREPCTLSSHLNPETLAKSPDRGKLYIVILGSGWGISCSGFRKETFTVGIWACILGDGGFGRKASELDVSQGF